MSDSDEEVKSTIHALSDSMLQVQANDCSLQDQLDTALASITSSG